MMLLKIHARECLLFHSYVNIVSIFGINSTLHLFFVQWFYNAFALFFAQAYWKYHSYNKQRVPNSHLATWIMWCQAVEYQFWMLFIGGGVDKNHTISTWNRGGWFYRSFDIDVTSKSLWNIYKRFVHKLCRSKLVSFFLSEWTYNFAT